MRVAVILGVVSGGVIGQYIYGADDWTLRAWFWGWGALIAGVAVMLISSPSAE